jgi:hypothetical protein
MKLTSKLVECLVVSSLAACGGGGGSQIDAAITRDSRAIDGRAIDGRAVDASLDRHDVGRRQ